MDPAHGDDKRIVSSNEFDYDLVDERIFGCSSTDPDALTQDDIDRALKLFSTLLQWMWQDAKNNPEGLQIRAMICCWIFLKELRPLQLSELARGFGKDKQSLGRWHDHFKRKFPTIKTPHMRPT